MATYLTIEAVRHLMTDPKLQAEICDHIGIDVSGVKTAAVRNSRSLTTYYAVKKIAESMDKQPEDILEELPN